MYFVSDISGETCDYNADHLRITAAGWPLLPLI